MEFGEKFYFIKNKINNILYIKLAKKINYKHMNKIEEKEEEIENMLQNIFLKKPKNPFNVFYKEESKKLKRITLIKKFILKKIQVPFLQDGQI